VTIQVLPLDHLVSPFGVVGGLVRSTPIRGLPDVSSITAVLAQKAVPPGRAPETEGGTGRTLDDPALASIVAVAEAAERYSGKDRGEQFTWAEAGHPPGSAIDLSRIPRCSAEEYAKPGCPLVPVDLEARIRWVQGTDLATGEPTWVPAVMAAFGLHVAPQERFWYRISTGYAIHTDVRQALIGAILEVVERDMISIVWLNRLRLPVLPAAELSPRAQRLVNWAEQHFIQTMLFDATSDLGVPTVYLLQIAEHDPKAAQLIGCGTGDTLASAAERALLESVTIRELYSAAEPPADQADFLSTLDGARFMARREQRAAFDFLLGDEDRGARQPVTDLPENRDAALRHVLGLLRQRDLQAVMVDRTTAELRAVGLTSVCVIIPGLQPMTLHPYAQYRAHPRLRAAAEAMGYSARSESEFNPWPQPFA
jgi:ribosomal protein S12 methylthiotransferase accessory factor